MAQAVPRAQPSAELGYRGASAALSEHAARLAHSPQGRHTPTRKHVPVEAGVESARGKQGAGGGRRGRRVFSRLARVHARVPGT